MNAIKPFFILLSLFFLTGCVGNMNPTGGNSTPNYPYFITKEPLVVKKILVPKGTTLVYEESFFKEGQQSKMMSEQSLTAIELPIDEPMDWGGIPAKSIRQFYNSAMRGFTVVANFDQLDPIKKTKFAKLWQSCDEELGITVKDLDDWSFNKNNIADVESCSVIYQRYFEKDANQQKFLDELFIALQKVNSESKANE